jgi:hypothetical protein
VPGVRVRNPSLPPSVVGSTDVDVVAPEFDAGTVVVDVDVDVVDEAAGPLLDEHPATIRNNTTTATERLTAIPPPRPR